MNAQIWLKLVHVYEKIRDSLKLRQCETDEMKNNTNGPKVCENGEITEKVKEISVEKCAKNTGECENCEICTNGVTLLKTNELSTREKFTSSENHFQNKCLKEVKTDKNPTGSLDLSEDTENVIQQIDTRCLKSLLTEYPINMILLTCYVRTRYV